MKILSKRWYCSLFHVSTPVSIQQHLLPTLVYYRKTQLRNGWTTETGDRDYRGATCSTLFLCLPSIDWVGTLFGSCKKRIEKIGRYLLWKPNTTVSFKPLRIDVHGLHNTNNNGLYWHRYTGDSKWTQSKTCRQYNNERKQPLSFYKLGRMDQV